MRKEHACGACAGVQVCREKRCGCQPMVYEAHPPSGCVDIRVKNYAGMACSQACSLCFLVIN